MLLGRVDTQHGCRARTPHPLTADSASRQGNDLVYVAYASPVEVLTGSQHEIKTLDGRCARHPSQAHSRAQPLSNVERARRIQLCARRSSRLQSAERAATFVDSEDGGRAGRDALQGDGRGAPLTVEHASTHAEHAIANSTHTLGCERDYPGAPMPPALSCRFLGHGRWGRA